MLSGVAAGGHAALVLPPGAGGDAVVACCAQQALRVYGSSRYRSEHSVAPPELVIGFGNVPTRQLQAGIRLLGQLIAETDRGADATTALLPRSSSHASALPTVR